VHSVVFLQCFKSYDYFAIGVVFPAFNANVMSRKGGASFVAKYEFGSFEEGRSGSE